MWELTDEGTVDLPGVLDVCAAGETTGDGDSVYAACAENAVVEIRAGGTGGKGCSLGLGREVTAREVECGSLKLAVDVKADGEQTHLVAASDSRGGVCLYRVRAGKGEMEEVERRQMHDLEAWSVCMRERGAGDGRQRLYSGGDDGSVCGWEMGAEGDMFRLRTGHCGVGVTAVATEEGREHELWTGGYDDMVRVWDVRAMKEAMCEVGVGGGVWRIKFHPRKNLVLVAAMYDGFKVVERSGDELRVVCDYQEHESLAYGACWLPGLDRAGTATALTGSFYDCSVRLWSVSTDG